MCDGFSVHRGPFERCLVRFGGLLSRPQSHRALYPTLPLPILSVCPSTMSILSLLASVFLT